MYYSIMHIYSVNFTWYANIIMVQKCCVSLWIKVIKALQITLFFQVHKLLVWVHLLHLIDPDSDSLHSAVGFHYNLYSNQELYELN